MKKKSGTNPRPRSEAVIKPPSSPRFARIRALALWLRPIIALLVVIVCLWFWFVTYGSGRLFAPEGFGQFYDSLADSLKDGRLDVSPAVISGEAYVYKGKSYGYFGPTPALARIPLTALFPDYAGRWSRFSVLLAALAHLFVLLAVLRHLKMRPGWWLVQVLVVALTLGSTLVYIVSRSFVYNEAIIWASAFALWCWYAMLRFVDGQRTSWLVAACFFGAASFFARVTVGAGVLTGLLFLFFAAPGEARMRNRILIAACLTSCSGLFFWMNYTRFGSIVEAVPYKYYIQSTPERLARVGGTIIHPEIFPFQMREVFAGRGLQFRKAFPWLEFSAYTRESQWPRHYDFMDSHAGLLFIETGLVLLAGFGLTSGMREGRNRREKLAITVALCVPILALGIFATLSHRYLHDVYPILFVGSIYGVKRLMELPASGFRTTLQSVIAVVLLLAVPANMALALVAQREQGFAIDESAKKDFHQMQVFFNRLLLGGPSVAVGWKPTEPVPTMLEKGLVARADFGAGVTGRYEFDGREWRLTAGTDGQRMALQVDLRGVPEGRYTLLSTGSAGACDVLMLDWRGDKSQFSLDHWTESVTWGDAFAASGDRKHDVVMMMDRLNGRVAVEWDGKQVYLRRITPHPFDPKLILIGRSPAPDVHPPPFPGELVRQ